MITEFIQTNSLKWDRFLSHGKRIFLKKDSTIYNQGDMLDGVYWVEKGLVQIKSSSNQGNVKNINMIGSGNFFGEFALINAPAITTAITLEDSVVYYFTVQDIKSLFRDFDESIMIILNSLLHKMAKMTETSFLETAEQQIAYTLLELSEHYHDHRIAIKQKELSEHTGLTRMTLNKVLKKWNHSGIIETENKVITIKNKRALDGYSRMNAI
ncbi:Crp/Fnr family transcriptional regulator [Niallia endozanthoxylica]|uniref:Crp/Fnr family transcriptional regulator n=1 Tax=Niallia endozanthoxylica TaxID=2036016 RepID=A0A5J5I8M0_9BACI|nr:Crp/Fnr family transcriptional regulator [Niallia endozanthoxylica]KAA9032374.1 Crp/Fnr family transcriptional regulator [Niallia endozanthoxylica]